MSLPVEEHLRELADRRKAPLATRTDLNAAATKDIAAAMNGILADVFGLYVKTKNFHWHMSGPHFRDYHLLLDEQADQLYAMTDPIAERIRKLGGATLKSIGHIARMQRVLDNDAEYVEPLDMLAELCEDNKEAHNVAEEHRDIASACVAFPALDAKAQGFKVHAVLDTSGDPSEFTSRITMARLSQAGVVPTSANAVMCEFQQHWNRPNNEAFAALYTDVAPNYRAVMESYQKAQEVVQKAPVAEPA